jgi:tetratricopeptide (TPR) repeat protein
LAIFLRNPRQIVTGENFDQDKRDIRKEATMTTNEVIGLLRKGRAYASRTRYREAVACYEKALALDPGNPETWYLRAAVFIETGRNMDALADCGHAIVLNQNYAAAWSKKGHALYNLERYDDALFACTRALALNGNDAAAWYIRGVCLEELGRNDEAQEAFGKSLELEIILDLEAGKKKAGT